LWMNCGADIDARMKGACGWSRYSVLHFRTFLSFFIFSRFLPLIQYCILAILQLCILTRV
ncbi:hypothetical protein MKX03_003467, partial [Papaver bracteatum]